MLSTAGLVVVIWVIFAGWIVFRTRKTREEPTGMAPSASPTPPAAPPATAVPGARERYDCLTTQELWRELGVARSFRATVRDRPDPAAVRIALDLNILIHVLEELLRGRGEAPQD